MDRINEAAARQAEELGDEDGDGAEEVSEGGLNEGE
jgi:hypothetical protein